MHDPILTALMLTALALAVTAAGLLRAARARRALRRRQRDGLRLIRLLKTLMGQMQVHRGLASLLLNGDTAKRPELASRQDDIAASLRALARQADPTLLTPSRMARIRDYWRDIETNYDGWDPQQSFDRHSALIRQVLFLIGDVADHGSLRELPGGGDSLNTPWTELPAAAEAIGQARAVGAGVAAVGHCDSVARIRLRYLHQRLLAASRDLGALPGAAAGCPPKVAQLLDELDAGLLQPARPTISASRYFGLASEALESVYAVFEQATAGLERQLA